MLMVCVSLFLNLHSFFNVQKYYFIFRCATGLLLNNRKKSSIFAHICKRYVWQCKVFELNPTKWPTVHYYQDLKV